VRRYFRTVRIALNALARTVARVRDGWRAIPPDRQDLLLAAMLLVLGLLEAAFLHHSGSRTATAAGEVFICGSVALRRRNPLLAVVILGAATWAQQALGGFALNTGYAMVLSAVIVIYSLGAYAEGWALYTGIAVQCVLFVAGAFVFKDHNSTASSNAIFGVVMGCVLPVAAGIAMRGRRRLVGELHQRSQQLVAEREGRARSAVAAERARIAGELHDVVSHNVSVMVVQAGAARRLIKTDVDRASEAMLAIENTGRAALDEMRRLLGVLRRGDEELALAPQPTLKRVEHLVNLARALGLDAQLHVEGDPVELPLGLDVAAYRIVQEALNSAQAHAPGAHTDVAVRYRPSELELEVVNGPPAHGAEVKAQSVLVGLGERVQLFGGVMHAGRRRGGGYGLRARLPLDGATT
jgi:signal transduction histidine kinase